MASAFPAAADISLTIHGVGYGLDEVACFEAQLLGMTEAIRSGDVPKSLRAIKIIEINPGRADRLRGQLEELVPGAVAVVEGDPAIATPIATADRRHAFVAMPFAHEFDDLFDYAIVNATHANDLLAERIDKQAFTGDILERMKDQISTATVVIADVTGANANVYPRPEVLVLREHQGFGEATHD